MLTYYDYEEDFAVDHGFNESDVQFLFMTKDGEKIELKKNRNWAEDENGNMDYEIYFELLKDGKRAMALPTGATRQKVEQVAGIFFEADNEATKEIDDMNSIQEMEMRYGA